MYHRVFLHHTKCVQGKTWLVVVRNSLRKKELRIEKQDHDSWHEEEAGHCKNFFEQKRIKKKTMKKRQVRQHFLRQISLQLLKDFLGFANYFIVQLEETKNNWPAKPCNQNICVFYV